MTQIHTSPLIQSPGILAIPKPKALFAVRFKRIQQFSIRVMSRNADEAFADTVHSFQNNEGRAQLLASLLDCFTIENLTKSQGE